jgi:deoxyribose-phosphate aldolase
MTENTASRRIAIGADHGGFELKEKIKAHLQSQGYPVHDCGTHSTDAVDYPVFARAVAERVSRGEADLGILIDGAGIGSSMVANKVPGVRAALCYYTASANNAREHNDANVLTMGSGFVGPNLALQIVDVFLSTKCTAERHLRRVGMIETGAESGGESGGGTGGGTGATPAPAVHTCQCQEKSMSQNLPDIDADTNIDRIVQRIVELAGGGDIGCTTLACGFCKACAQANPEMVRQFLEMGADRIVHQPGTGNLPRELAASIDHTLLKPDATTDQIISMCEEARDYGFASVCVNPVNVKLVANQLKGTHVKACSVVGFPLGATTPEIKAMEARRAIRDGAREIDMVINVGALKSGDDDLVYRDIRAVTEVCMDGRSICKVILETALLNDDEKVRACQAAKRARADFVKTSTGFGPGGATAADVALMSQAVSGTRMGVKASGGIRDLDSAQEMIHAGATRLGVSAGVKIVKQAKGMTVSDGSSKEKY